MPESSSLTRRHFLYAVGGSAAAVLAGWVVRDRERTSPAPAAGDAPPRLRSGIAIVPCDSGAELFDTGAPGRAPLCGVNHLGAFVLTQLDGRRSVAGLAARVAAHTPRAANLEAIEASVALFLAELGSAGVLASPFRVNIHACEIGV